MKWWIKKEKHDGEGRSQWRSRNAEDERDATILVSIYVPKSEKGPFVGFIMVQRPNKDRRIPPDRIGHVSATLPVETPKDMRKALVAMAAAAGLLRHVGR